MSRLKVSLSTQALAKLFRVQCLHTYYGDQICKDFEISPSPETELELKNCRLIFKPTPGGFIIFHHTSQSGPLLKSPAFRPKKLTFFIRNSNLEFLNFSDLPYLDADSLLYFSNLKQKAATKETKQKLLHTGAHVGEEKGEGLPARPQAFDFEFVEDVAYEKLLVTDVFGKEVLLPEVAERVASYPKRRHYIDLSDYPEGFYTLKVKGNQTFSSDFYASAPALEGCQGVIDIFLTEEVGKAFQIADNKGIYPQDYQVQIQARSTFWRYNLITRSDAEFSSHKIESKEHKVAFSKPEQVTLLNGTQATRLTSQSPLPLSQFAEYKFELTMKKNGRGLRTPIRLPIPSTKMIQPDLTDNKKIYSEMYVYL